MLTNLLVPLAVIIMHTLSKHINDKCGSDIKTGSITCSKCDERQKVLVHLK